MAGYAQKRLADKLGVRSGGRAIVLRAPADYMDLVPELGEQMELVTRLAGWFDFMQYFATSAEQLEAVLPNLKRHVAPTGILWICWVKKTSPRHTGLDENRVRQLGLAAGLVDVKVAALTEDWSGLKFVYRVSDRENDAVRIAS